MNILIGAGAVNSVLACYLLKANEPVSFAVRSGREQHYSKPQTLALSGNHNASFPRPVVSSTADYTQAQRVFIGCKHQHLPAVISELRNKLPSTTILLPCLNGVSHLPLLSEAFPNNPICPVTVMFNAQLPEPMAPVLTTSPLLYIDGHEPELIAKLSKAGMQVKQGSIATAWGKLILNLNNAIGALTESTFKDLLLSKAHRNAGLATFDEATHVLEQAGIKFDVPIPVSWKIQRFTLRYLPAIAWLIAKKRNQLSDQSFPSMLADIKSGQVTEVEQLNGEIVRQAEDLGLQAPVNKKLQELVTSRHKKPASFISIEQLIEQLGLNR